jgi:hypothetical protein
MSFSLTCLMNARDEPVHAGGKQRFSWSVETVLTRIEQLVSWPLAVRQSWGPGEVYECDVKGPLPKSIAGRSIRVLGMLPHLESDQRKCWLLQWTGILSPLVVVDGERYVCMVMLGHVMVA